MAPVFDDRFYEGFGPRWTEQLERIAGETGIDSLLIMRSTPTHMVTAASAGPRRDTYHPGDAGPKSVNPGRRSLPLLRDGRGHGLSRSRPVAQGRTGDTEFFRHAVAMPLREQCDQGHMVDRMAQHEVAFALER